MANSTIDTLLDSTATFLLSEMGRSVSYIPNAETALAESITAIMDIVEYDGNISGLESEFSPNIANRCIFYIRREDLSAVPDYLDVIEDDEEVQWEVLRKERMGAFWKIYASNNERAF